ncbi:hypothetical protein F4553_002426 [Allocatelliglobosispora scoriae]|uniref:ATP-grasp domain-containing protein n=1 Tax=Allocatelliglobosispora scoriae TaxID=643052 RepID=A0A841BIV5_9ACTN|nr:ATP-grasp domain-containing protein [Allocatelliglobosispora scoriae]MBB5869047.1 hypothetical protein [Allocatelliglobosispora scoriae]
MTYAIIVDPLSTGQEYGPAFREAGATPIAVLSGLQPPDSYLPTWFPENYEAVHYFDGDVSALAEQLRGYLVDGFVIPGAESGVELADQLIDRLTPGAGNVSPLNTARRDKRAMSAALGAAGVPRLRQISSDDPAVIDAWLADNGLVGRRLVIKPPKGGGGDEVHIIAEDDDWRTRFAEILGNTNKLGVHNDEVLVQEYAEGTEYLVDSYSVDGRHALVDVCRYTKIRRGDQIGIYRRIDFLEPDHPEVLAIWPYTQQVLDAVGIRVGCGHAEVMLTPDGPRLIEVAARPAGGGHQMVSDLATGDNHIKRTVAHRLRGEFRESFDLVQRLRGIFVSAHRAGILRNGEVLQKAEALASFHWMRVMKENGALVPETVDLFTCLAWVILIHQDLAVLDEDYDRVLELEAEIQIDPV